MFRWYQAAQICYAVLDDVSLSPCSNSEASSEPDQEKHTIAEQLHTARWFTRGWTLQELIAPRKLWFFDSKWTFFGNRESLLETLAHITGIHTSILQDPLVQLGRVNVAVRMSWAATRTTTRTEDIAYCLMSVRSLYSRCSDMLADCLL